MFLVFEGLDGAGKSTLIRGLTQDLESKGISYHVTREPGGTPLGDEIRKLLITPSEHAPSPLSELFLYEAGRAQHVDKVIRPLLAKKTWVISDRYYASTMAFQAGGRVLDLNKVRELNAIAAAGVHPDLWVLLDLTVEEAQKRMAGRSLDRFEQEKKDFHERVRQAYLAEVQREPERWLVLDASKSPAELIETLLIALKEKKWLK
jgi:dTMP kinase